VYILPEDGHRSGPKHVVGVHNKIEHKKYLLRAVVLIKVLVDTHNEYKAENSKAIPVTVCDPPCLDNHEMESAVDKYVLTELESI
jgi:hypothetical protein